MDEGKPVVPISVNLSRRDFEQEDLVEDICRLIDRYEIPHRYIHMEVTESAYTENPEQVIRKVTGLRKAGFQIEMDDFGTGYSSMALLKDMPLDIIKIDKSFIDGIATGEPNNKDMLITQDILTMSRHLGIKSLAEGVETFEQKEYLREWGCHYIQGYYYSKPIPITGYEYLLKKIMLGQD